MKAWKCYCKNAYTDSSVVVFAETRGKAHWLAMREDVFEDAEWTDICVRRIPALDNHFRGGTVLCWDNDEDRQGDKK